MKYLILALFLFVNLSLNAQFKLVHLKSNYQSTPLGTDLPIPQFSWQMLSDKSGITQTAYQIRVYNEKNELQWDSQKVFSGVAHAIQYQGKSLMPKTSYRWKLRVWDNFKKSVEESSWFETGLMLNNQAAFPNAQWIGPDDSSMILYSQYLSVFKLQFSVKLLNESTRAAFVFGANDSRLQNPVLNLMGVKTSKKQSYIALELNTEGLKLDTGTAHLNIYRVAYTNEDNPLIPFKSIAISKTLLSNANKNDKHTIFAECNFGVFEFYLDTKDAQHKIQDESMKPAGPFSPAGLNLNPVGKGNNFISFPMLGSIGFKTDHGQAALFSDVLVKNFRFPENVLFTENLENDKTIFEGIEIQENAYYVHDNALIIADPSKNAAPMLRKTFKINAQKPLKARLYITARGIYEAQINGKKIADDYFNPGLTQYNVHHAYQTYDISDFLKYGEENAIAVSLGEGWWSGNITYSGENWNYFGDRQSLMAQLVITYEDGTEQIINSDDTWKFYADGPIRYGSFFQGEVYDATKEATVKGWEQANFNDTQWKSVAIVPLENTAYMGAFTLPRGEKSIFSYDKMNLVGQMGDNAKVVETLTAIGVEEVRPGVFVYDMGQNMVGIPKITLRNTKAGDQMYIRYAEIKYPNLPDYKGNEGMVMMENIRAALASDTYIMKGGTEVMQPHFTFHGYRYLEITGIKEVIPLADVQGLVISSVADLSSAYSTNNTEVNKLWENITWSLRSNFLSIPTDCPQRNERMGWSGDISVFAKSATYLTDGNLFLRRHLMAMRDIQPESGRFTDVAPVGGGFGGTLWGSAGITVAYETYQQYGDLQLLEEHYTAMKKYLDFLASKVNEQGILNEGPLGDWLSPEGNKNDNTLFWMAYYAYDLDLMAKMANVLGLVKEAQGFSQSAAQIKRTFNQVYVQKNTGKTVKSGIRTGFMGAPNEADRRGDSEKGKLIDTQASYAIPLALKVINEENRELVIKNLAETIRRENPDDGGVIRPQYSLMTGFIGTAAISEALSANGQNELAYKLLLNRQYPSWLYSVVNGATSIWERLNSYTLENGFGGNNSMNSFNHYSFGAVAAWMYAYSLGIQRDENSAGFKHFILKPHIDPNNEIKSAKGHFDSNYGRIESAWESNNEKVVYHFTIPANSSATLYLPVNDAFKIKVVGKGWSKSKRSTSSENIYELLPGRYTFVVNL